MKKSFILLLFVLAVFVLLSACSRREQPKKIDLSQKDAVKESAENNSLRIAVSGMISPKETFVYYRQILDFIAGKLGRKVELVQRETYVEVNQMLEKGELDCAFVCSGPYVDGHKEFGLELIAAPVSKIYRQPVYYSYIIVPIESRINKFEELRGKRFAYTDALSNTGKLFPDYLVSQQNSLPGDFFSETIYTNNHDRSIAAVAENIVDGAAVDSLIWDYYNQTEPSSTSKTKIILKSPPYGIPPVVATAKLDPEIKKTLKNILLSMHLDNNGKKILDNLLIERFIEVEDSNYDSIREMKAWLNKQKEK